MSNFQLPVITSIQDLGTFRDIMESNPGLIIMKLGAVWCGPCQAISQEVKAMFDSMPSNVQCISIDIDENIELYSLLKKKRVVNGVPAVLCYRRGNLSNIPDDHFIGANKENLKAFGDRCLKNAISIAHRLT